MMKFTSTLQEDSLTCRAPRAHLLPHSLFLLPRHQNTHNRDNTIYSRTVHHQHLQERPVEKQRHQEPLCRENQQRGGNPRNTSSSGYEPKEFATVSRMSGITDPYPIYDAQKEFGEQDHQAPITKEMKEFGESGTQSLPDYLETSSLQLHMHFDDSVEGSADSDLEDGELQ